MSVANVVLLGFTTGAGGHLLPTLGFTPGDAVVPGEAAHGAVVAGDSRRAPFPGRSSRKIAGRSEPSAVRARSTR